MATPNYTVNYDDKRFVEVEADKKAALSEVEKTYGGMVNNSDKYYDKQIENVQNWADKQTQLQQQQTDFAIEQINQQKDQAKKDYTKEQSGAYVDWQKQSNPYGANAEAVAAQGMANTGYSESSQVAMYNQYQNRVATARESYNRAVLNYDNAIKDARLQNNAALAEIAFNALQQELELSLQGFQYKNQLLIEQANKKMEVEDSYYRRYQDVLDQINTENALAEEVRQYNASLAEEQRQYNATLAMQKAQLAEEQRQFNETMAYNKAKSNGGSGGGSGSIKKSSGGSSKKTYSSIQNKPTQSINYVTSKKNNNSGGGTIDMASVLALGYGPISASRLNELVSQGIIEEYQSGGKTKFRKTASTIKQQMLFG